MKALYLLICLFTASLIASAQHVNKVSTNPHNPIHLAFLPWANIHLGSGFTYDPFINKFNWSPVDSNGNQIDLIPVAYNTGFNIAEIVPLSNMVPMRNPFNTGLIANAFEYNNSILKPKLEDRDFKWEDGWELLYMNLGYTPDLIRIDMPNPLNPLSIQGPTPNNIPYFVLYNRYKGTIRLFAKAWFNSTMAIKSQKVITTIRFSTKEINGLLRHNNAYDLALDTPSIIQSVSGPSFNSIDQLSWFISDFQMGFDPCICSRTTNITRINFEFSTLKNLDIYISNRRMLYSEEITDESYLTNDFLNLNDIKDVSSDNSRAASKIYAEMGNLLASYKTAQAKYETELANYNSLEGKLKRAAIDVLQAGVKSTGSMVGAGVAGSLFTNSSLKNFVLKNKTRVGLFSDGLIALDTNDADAFAKSVTGAAKSILAAGFDFLSTTIEDPEKPKAPSPPTATFTETTYKGTISTDSRFKTDDLMIPGSLPNSFPNGNPGVNRLNYPAYNEVLGLFALLETPKVEVVCKRMSNYTSNFKYVGVWTPIWEGYSRQKKHYQVKLKDKLSYRFNHVVNFNFDKTKLYYSFRIKLKNVLPKVKNTPDYIDKNLWHKNTKAYNQVVTDSNFFFVESYDKSDRERYIILSTPFAEVKNMLNEPFEFTNFTELLYYLVSLNANRSDVEGKSFDALIEEFSFIESIELKLMADMYFLSPGSKGQEINTLQTFTYLVYQFNENDDQTPIEQDNLIGNVTFLNTNKQILKHQSGNVVFDHVLLSPSTLQAYTHTRISGNEIHIWVENATLKNTIRVANGYQAFIHFLGSAISLPETDISPNLVLDNMPCEALYQYPFIYEASDAEVNSFCSSNSNKYQANSLSAKRAFEQVESNLAELMEDRKPVFQLYPNPANEYVMLAFDLGNSPAATISIFNLAGVEVKQMELKQEAMNVINIETASFTSGVYFVTLTTPDGNAQTQKLLVVK